MSKPIAIVLAIISLLAAIARSEEAVFRDLVQGFQSPPASARPYTWWHWCGGNVTKEGITADLEAMQRIGVGGAQIFNLTQDTPPGPVHFMSPQWLELTRFAAQEADRLGLELGIQNCAGWSASGGPWNTPEHAMQIIVTSEVQVAGPKHFQEVLPQPTKCWDFYRDIAVFALPAFPQRKNAWTTSVRKRPLSAAMRSIRRAAGRYRPRRGRCLSARPSSISRTG